jgi:plastocyanin
MRTRRLVPSVLGLAVVLASAGVRAGKEGSPGAPGAISGTVKYLGKPPVRSPIDRSSDAACTGEALSEEVVVAGGKLADVHVRIQSGTVPGKHDAPKAPIVIEQTGCAYRPRVVGAMVGQGLVIKNGDPTMHNVHAYAGEETAFNRSQPKRSKPIEHPDLGKAGQVFTLKCDVHAWMRAFLPVSDHPYFAVTPADGSFSLTRVPPGTYTLEAYHPKLGIKKKQVVVESGKTATIDFIFP